MSTVLYRQLDANNDPKWGNGQGNFVSDVDAVAQALKTGFQFLAGEWWENLSLGFPLFQQLLGAPGSGRNLNASVQVILAQINSTIYVTGPDQVSAGYNPNNRDFQFACIVQTQFGPIALYYTPPGSSAIISS